MSTRREGMRRRDMSTSFPTQVSRPYSETKKNKQVLIDLINAILPPDRTVRELSYSTTEIPGFTLANKSVRLDLRCTGQDGRKFIVEVQCYSQEHFFRRCVEYAAKVYDSGSLKGGNIWSARKRLAENDDTLPGYDIPPVYFTQPGKLARRKDCSKGGQKKG